MFSPLHEHPLEQVNPVEVYRFYGGRWKCHHCNFESDAIDGFRFHCRQCSFDLCYSCMNMQHQGSRLMHRHPLHYMDTSRMLDQNEGGIWRCNVCKKTSDVLRERFSHHCRTCGDFDVCRSCYRPKRHPIHIHELKVIDTSLTYPETGGNWVCKSCRKQSRPCEVVCHSCRNCNFDVCLECTEPRDTTLHQHLLLRTDLNQTYAQFNGEWQCNHCRSRHRGPFDKPWHCHQCNYNLCKDCISVEGAASSTEAVIIDEMDEFTDLPGASIDFQQVSSPFLGSGQVNQTEHYKDQKIMELQRLNADLERQIQEANRRYENEVLCIMCCERKRDVVFVHEDGTIRHSCCCSECASRLDSCPICRSGIIRRIPYPEQ